MGAVDARLAASMAPDDVPYRIDEGHFAAALRWAAGGRHG
jgi:hypothetical protein